MKMIYLLLATLLVAGCNQNVQTVRSDETLEDSPSPVPPAEPRGPFEMPRAVEGEREVPPFVKAYFMHTWVEALYSMPQNKNPNPDWVSPLIDPAAGRVWCTDCHVSGQVDFERIPKMRVPMVDEFENDREFMVDLMRKWVSRLNSEEYFARAKLSGPVTCLTCHATNPAEADD